MGGAASVDDKTAERIMLGGRYQVRPDRPLPDLDSPLADAVQVTDTRAVSRKMFGLVCRPGLMPRVDIIPQLSRLAQLSMLNPSDAGTVAWPQSGGRRFVIVFDRMPGERLAAFGSDEITRLSEDRLARTVIAPMMPVLRELGSRLITHRAIRADNLTKAARRPCSASVSARRRHSPNRLPTSPSTAPWRGRPGADPGDRPMTFTPSGPPWRCSCAAASPSLA